MDRDTNKKRARFEAEFEQHRGAVGVATAASAMTGKKKKGKKERDETLDVFLLLDEDKFDPIEASPGACHRPPGLFEFPWQKGERLLIPEPDDWDLRDVFFSSLVDGCSAAIGFPGDRLSPGVRGSIGLPEITAMWPSDGEADGVDCIWSSVLRQPLSTSVYSKDVDA